MRMRAKSTTYYFELTGMLLVLLQCYDEQNDELETSLENNTRTDYLPIVYHISNPFFPISLCKRSATFLKPFIYNT